MSIFSTIPSDFELAYGRNFVSIFDTDYSTSNPVKYILNLKYLNGQTFASFKQTPNPVGLAHFDVSDVLQNLLSSRPDLETVPKLSLATHEALEYKVSFNTYTTLEPTEKLVVFNGRKNYYTKDFDSSDFTPLVATVNNDLTVFRRSVAFTDYPSTSFNITTIPVNERPFFYNYTTPDTLVKNLYAYADDDYTLSFLNRTKPQPGPGYGYPNSAASISGFYLSAFINGTEYTSIILNQPGNGGFFVDFPSELPSDKANGVSVQIGASSTFIQSLPSTPDYIYVAGYCYKEFSPTEWNYLDPGLLLTEVYKLNILEPKCNDYENVQVSWTNSFGFRDYFNFTKRFEKTININRQTYTQDNVNWTSFQALTLNPYNRGERVFKTDATTSYTLNTKYLNDDESKFLENLFISSDVRVRLPGQPWRPCVLESNSYVEKTFRKDRLFQHTINIKMANENLIQNG